jgi:hypothetical protein
MRLIAPALCLLLILGGCASYTDHSAQTGPEKGMFGPVSMRIHPIFTQIKDWTGDGAPDGIDALVEFQDQFGDPTKAAGQVVFELYEFRPSQPDPRGPRLANPWIGTLETVPQQQSRWNRTSRTYSFQLAFPGIRTDRNYVLTAMFELSNGGRFFDRIILEPPPAPQSK